MHANSRFKTGREKSGAISIDGGIFIMGARSAFSAPVAAPSASTGWHFLAAT